VKFTEHQPDGNEQLFFYSLKFLNYYQLTTKISIFNLLQPFIMKTTAEILEIVKTLEKDYDFNDILVNYIDVDELAKCIDTDEVIELFRKANKDEDITRAKIIYYADAIEYLSENDPSLNDSISLAIDM